MVKLKVTKRYQETVNETVHLDWVKFGEWVDSLDGYYDADSIESAQLGELIDGYFFNALRTDTITSITAAVVR